MGYDQNPGLSVLIAYRSNSAPGGFCIAGQVAFGPVAAYLDDQQVIRYFELQVIRHGLFPFRPGCGACK
jgi:hypothetical protein